MRTLFRIALVGVLMSSLAGVTMGQEGEAETNGTTRTMRPVVRGRHFAVAAMKAEATRAAERVLEKGVNDAGRRLPGGDRGENGGPLFQNPFRRARPPGVLSRPRETPAAPHPGPDPAPAGGPRPH